MRASAGEVEPAMVVAGGGGAADPGASCETPATGDTGVVACDRDGKPLWHRDLGPVLHKWGNGSSPILYRDLLIVFHGPGEPTFLTAPPGEPCRRKTDDQVPCDRAITMCPEGSHSSRASRYTRMGRSQACLSSRLNASWPQSLPPTLLAIAG